MKKWVLALLSTAALGASDELWHRSAQTLAEAGLTLSSSDKAGGVIQGAAQTKPVSPWFTCDRGAGRFDHIEYTVTVVVGDDVKVTATGRGAYYQNRHFLVFKHGQVWNYVECKSTGVLEHQLLAKIKA